MGLRWLTNIHRPRSTCVYRSHARVPVARASARAIRNAAVNKVLIIHSLPTRGIASRERCCFRLRIKHVENDDVG